MRRRALWLLVLCLGADHAAALPDLGGGWTANPTEVQSFLEGSAPWRGSSRSAWVRTASGDLWGWPQLPRTLLSVGRGGSGGTWRRLGGAREPWREDLVRAVWSSRRFLRGDLDAEVLLAGPRGAAWPISWGLIWRPRFQPAPGWRLSAAWELAGRRRSWDSRRRDRATLERSADPWLVRTIWWSEGDGGGLDVMAVRRFGPTAALEVGLDGGRQPRWGVVVRRGPLLIRSTQGWHALLGAWRAWEVSLCAGS